MNFLFLFQAFFFLSFIVSVVDEQWRDSLPKSRYILVRLIFDFFNFSIGYAS